MKSLPISIFGRAVFFTLLSAIVALSVSATDSQSIGDTTVESFSDRDVVLKEFKDVYYRISKLVENGNLERESMDGADLLAIELKKYLITIQARVETLKLDTLVAEKRDNALEALMSVSADQERTKISFLAKLKKIEGGTLDESTLAGSGKTGERWRVTTTDFEIEITPEDITQGHHD